MLFVPLYTQSIICWSPWLQRANKKIFLGRTRQPLVKQQPVFYHSMSATRVRQALEKEAMCCYQSKAMEASGQIWGREAEASANTDAIARRSARMNGWRFYRKWICKRLLNAQHLRMVVSSNAEKSYGSGVRAHLKLYNKGHNRFLYFASSLFSVHCLHNKSNTRSMLAAYKCVTTSSSGVVENIKVKRNLRELSSKHRGFTSNLRVSHADKSIRGVHTKKFIANKPLALKIIVVDAFRLCVLAELFSWLSRWL
jgi:hypothetical protein